VRCERLLSGLTTPFTRGSFAGFRALLFRVRNYFSERVVLDENGAIRAAHAVKMKEQTNSTLSHWNPQKETPKTNKQTCERGLHFSTARIKFATLSRQCCLFMVTMIETFVSARPWIWHNGYAKSRCPLKSWYCRMRSMAS
jgi:hypothetical protein